MVGMFRFPSVVWGLVFAVVCGAGCSVDGSGLAESSTKLQRDGGAGGQVVSTGTGGAGQGSGGIVGAGGGLGTGGLGETGGTTGEGGALGTGGTTGTGGTSNQGTGGIQGAGGTTSTGGSSGTGGATGAGGANNQGTGGTPGTGGITGGTGGAFGTGGDQGTGGMTSTGGKPGTGGMSAGTGGATATGGAMGTGGALGTGGMSGGTGGNGGPKCGPSNCNGCCGANGCVRNPTAAACGAKGGACMACAPCDACTAGACAIDPNSPWTIVADSVRVNMTPPGGGFWDPAHGDEGGTAPDLFCEYENPANDVSITTAGVTDTVVDVYTTTWDEVISPVGLTVSASVLMAANPTWRIWVGDEDCSGPGTCGSLGQTICSYQQPISAASLEAGQLTISNYQSCASLSLSFVCQAPSAVAP